MEGEKSRCGDRGSLKMEQRQDLGGNRKDSRYHYSLYSGC